MHLGRSLARVLFPYALIACADSTTPDRTDATVDVATAVDVTIDVAPDASSDDAATSVDAAFPACDDDAASDHRCSVCSQCAYTGRCSAEAAACEGQVDCAAILACFNMCESDNRACLDACQQQHPGGVSLFETVYECVTCRECAVSCQGFGFCP